MFFLYVPPEFKWYANSYVFIAWFNYLMSTSPIAMKFIDLRIICGFAIEIFIGTEKGSNFVETVHISAKRF